MTVKEAAAELGVSEGRIRQLIEANLLIAEKRGRDWTVSDVSVRQRREARKVKVDA